jgi:hypothetical protein
MMTKDEALRMAIEAFKTCETYNAYEQSFEIILVEKAINACKEALEQPAQEPVGEVTWFEGTVMGAIYPTSNMPKDGEKLYTNPHQALQPLSDDEILKIDKSINPKIDLKLGKMIFVRAIEKAHGIGVNDET